MQAFSRFIHIVADEALGKRRHALLFIASLPLFMMLGAAIVAAADTPVVSQAHRRFLPAELNVPAGTTVHFINDDNVTHHVYVDAPGMEFDSGEEPVGKAVDLTFAKSGTYQVLCAIHPTMHLKVTVQ